MKQNRKEIKSNTNTEQWEQNALSLLQAIPTILSYKKADPRIFY